VKNVWYSKFVRSKLLLEVSKKKGNRSLMYEQSMGASIGSLKNKRNWALPVPPGLIK